MPRTCRFVFALALFLCACSQSQPDAGEAQDNSGAAQEPAAPAAAPPPAAPAAPAPAAEAPAEAPAADPAKADPAAPSAPAAEANPKAKPATPGEPAKAEAKPVAPAAEAPTAAPAAAATVAGPCGEKGQPSCPLQGWMEENLQSASDDQDLIALAEGFTQAIRFVPDPSWNAGAQGWTAISNAGAAAAKAGDFATAKQACKSCHKAWRSKYKDSFRTRVLPK